MKTIPGLYSVVAASLLAQAATEALRIPRVLAVTGISMGAEHSVPRVALVDAGLRGNQSAKGGQLDHRRASQRDGHVC